MKKTINFLIAFLLIGFTINGGENSWSLLGPWGGTIREIKVHPTNPDIIYVANFSSGLYKSTDRGKTWTRLQDKILPVNGGYDIELDPQNPEIIYFSAWEGIFKSTDGGETWQKTLSMNLALDVEINPFNPQVLIAAVQSLYNSIDYGLHWDYSGFGNVSVYTVEYDPTRSNVFFVGTNFVHAKTTIVLHGVCKTTDNGKTFTPVRKNMEDLTSTRDIQLDPQDANKVYVVGVNERYFYDDERFTPYRSIFRSNDGGEIFNCINNGLEVNGVEKILIYPDNSDILYVCTREKGLYKSINGGESWLPKNEGVHELASQVVALDKKNGILYLGTQGSIYKSLDESETWQEISCGMNGFFMRSFAQNPLNPNTIYAAGSYLPRRSLDNGKNWQRIGKDDLGKAFVNQIAVDPGDTNVVYAGLASSFKNDSFGVYRSEDGGVTWQEKNNGLPYIPLIWDMKIVTNDSSTTLALGTTKGFFISFNGAETWEERNIGIDKLPKDREINTVAFDPNNTNTIYAGAAQLYKTENQGQNWHVIKSKPRFYYYEVFVNPHDSQEIFVSEDGGIFVSRNQGEDWELYMADGYMISISPTDPQLMLAARRKTAGRGMIISHDGGQTWQAMDTGWQKPTAYLIRFDVSNPNKVYVGCFSGLYSWTISPSAVTEQKHVKGFKGYSLFQNFPNPFNPETEIRYQLPGKEHVSLTVYNLLGQKIHTLVDKEMVTGYHTIKWDGNNDFGNTVASGVYLYAMQAGNFFEKKKMVLMR